MEGKMWSPAGAFAGVAGITGWVVADGLCRANPGEGLACAGLSFAAGFAMVRACRNRWAVLCLAIVLACGLFGLASGLRWSFERLVLPVFLGVAVAMPPVAVLLFTHTTNRWSGRARPGSIVDRGDRLRIWLATAFAVSALSAFVALTADAPSSLRSAIAFTAAIAVLAIAASDWTAYRQLDAALANVEPSDSEPAPSSAPTLDLGIGEERYSCGRTLGPAYRSFERQALVLIGNPDLVRPLIRRQLRVSSVLASLAVISAGFVASRTAPTDEPPPPLPSSLVLEPQRTDVQTGLSWYPSQRPILIDLNGDGTEDVIGLRWSSNQDARPLSVVATDGATFRMLWHTAPIKSQWHSPRTHLLRSTRRLFLTDSEGLLHIYDATNGREVHPAIAVAYSTHVCAVRSGTPAIWILNDRDVGPHEDHGMTIDGDGKATPGTRPAECEAREAPYTPSGSPRCHSKLRPAIGKHHAFFIQEVDGTGIGHDFGNGRLPRNTFFGFDPETCKVLWEGPLAFTSEPLHENPQLSTEITPRHIYGFYQLQNGRWLLGARDSRTGAVAWSHEAPRARLGSNSIALSASATRVYLALDWRLEVFAAEDGESLGVLW